MINLYRYKFKGNIITYLVIILVLLITILIPNTTQAVSVGVNYTGSWRYQKYVEGGSCSDFDAETNFTMSLSKNFDLNVARIGNLRTSETRVIRPGEGVVGVNYGVTGSYNYTSGDKRTPPLNGQKYNWNYISGPGWCNGVRFEVRNQMRGGISSQLGYTLSSSDNSVIDCSAGNSCVARDKDGTATITVSFPGAGSYYVERNFEWGENSRSYNYIFPTCRSVSGRTRDAGSVTTCSCPSGYTLTRQGPPNQGRGYSDTCKSNTPTTTWVTKGSSYVKKAFQYTLNPITYRVSVQKPNQKPTVRYKDNTNISFSTATAIWEYSDPENDAQTNAEIQVYTDASFTNLVTTKRQPGTTTSMNITGLRPGTTYYPRLRSRNDKNGWTEWVNGPSFTTSVNNPPNLEDLSCTVSNLPNNNSNKYTKAKLNWNYTGTDEPEDRLILKARWKISEEAENDWRVKRLDNQSGNINLNNLISGFTYQVQISLNDNRNAHLGDRWKECGIVTQPDYPKPNVEFSLSSGDGTASLDGTLNINTGDLVNANWSINNGTEVGLQQCALSTTEGNGVDLLSGTGFDGSATATGPEAPQDLTYKVRLKCEGKPAKSPVGVDQTINLKVQSVPTLSCSIENNKNLVKEGNTSITIIAQVGNISSYSWEVKRDINDVSNISSGNSPIPNRITLNYAGTAFGRYTPWIKINNQSNSKTAEAECGTVTNLGDSNIREISP